MNKIFLILTAFMITGCASTSKDQLYYEAAKSISKDSTVAQTACWNAVSDIAKNGDNSAKVGAITLAEKCKTVPIKVEAPKRSLLDLIGL